MADGYFRTEDQRQTGPLTSSAAKCTNYYMKTRRRTSKTMTEALREAIAGSELSFKALERETGVVRQSLMKFARCERSLRLDNADKLAEFFGIEVVKRKGD